MPPATTAPNPFHLIAAACAGRTRRSGRVGLLRAALRMTGPRLFPCKEWLSPGGSEWLEEPEGMYVFLEAEPGSGIGQAQR
jgi:hypothetical protein